MGDADATSMEVTIDGVKTTVTVKDVMAVASADGWAWDPAQPFSMHIARYVAMELAAVKADAAALSKEREKGDDIPL